MSTNRTGTAPERPTLARRKHPFHWDIYSSLYDRLGEIAASPDPRLLPEVRPLIEQARSVLWQAWDVQCRLEREQGSARP